MEQDKEITTTTSSDIQKTEEQPKDIANIVSDERLLGMYAEILNTIKDDRLELNETINCFKNAVVNDGDASTSSKEALVNLLKIKNDQADKMAKVADLMTRIKLKDSFPKYLAPQQNTINISGGNKKRAILEQIKKAHKEGKNEI